MKKTIKRMMAFVIAVVMIASTMGAFPAFAADTVNYDKPLTVTGLETGDTATFYKIIEWVGEAEGNVKGWKAVSTYASVLTQDVLTSILVGDPDNNVKPTGITSEIAGKLADLATGGESGTVADGTATFNNGSEGMWMALITPADFDNIYNPVFVSADYNKDAGGTVALSDDYKGDAVAKKSKVTLNKTAENTADYNGDHANTTAVGDIVTFTVTTTIPGYGDVYQDPHFDVVDTLTDLALKADTVTVTVPAGLTKGTEYTVTPDETNGYRLSFSKNYLKTLKTATNVTITYNAEVTTDAAQAINEETNEVNIEYSHNPKSETDYNVKKDTTQHYTFTLDADVAGKGKKLSGKKTSELVKVAVDADGKPIFEEKTWTSDITTTETWQGALAGAQFGLWKASDPKCEGTPFKTQTTKDDGRMKFDGLDAGTYYLKEISAPAGYVTNSDIHTIVIAAELEEVTVTEWFKDGAWSATDNGGKKVEYKTDILKKYTVTVDGTPAATYSFTNNKKPNSNEIQWDVVDPVEKPFLFPNTKGVELPSTGGRGTTIFYVIGGLLVLAAAIVLISRRRVQQ